MASRKSGKRTKSGRLSRAKTCLVERNPPADYILARRELFSWHRPTKGPDGRVGEIDQDICDAIGQLHACGLLDNHAHDPQELRDKGRLYAELWWRWYNATGYKMGGYERASRSTAEYVGLTPEDLLFKRLDQSLTGYERECVHDLCVDPRGDEMASWAISLIGEALRAKGKAVAGFPTMDDRTRLHACIQGLVALVEGSLPMRRAA